MSNSLFRPCCLLFALCGLAACAASRRQEVSLTLPPWFGAAAFADDVGAARHVVVAPNGDVYVAVWDRGKERGGVVALRDTDGDGRADVRERFGEEGGSGIALGGDSLYFATWTAVYRYRLRPGELAPKSPPDVILEGLPRSGHSARSIAVDAAGGLYVNIAAPTNSCQLADTERESPGKDPCPELEQFGGVWKFDAGRTHQRQSDGVRVATGLRNVVALALDPEGGALYGVQHGRDYLAENWPRLYTPEQGAENAAEEFFRIEPGGDYGWPYCYYDLRAKRKVLAPEYGGDGETVGRCADKGAPLMAFPAHWAPDGLLFYRGAQFPARFRQGAFVAFHGSWFRTPFPQEGFNVVFVPFASGRPAGDYEVFADGFAGGTRHPNGARHRPVGLAEGPDGALYVTDDQGGRVWRITYNRPL